MKLSAQDIKDLNFHAKYQENPWIGFRVKSPTNYPTNGNDSMGPGYKVYSPIYHKIEGLKSLILHIFFFEFLEFPDNRPPSAKKVCF